MVPASKVCVGKAERKVEKAERRRARQERTEGKERKINYRVSSCTRSSKRTGLLLHRVRYIPYGGWTQGTMDSSSRAFPSSSLSLRGFDRTLFLLQLHPSQLSLCPGSTVLECTIRTSFRIVRDTYLLQNERTAFLLLKTSYAYAICANPRKCHGSEIPTRKSPRR